MGEAEIRMDQNELLIHSLLFFYGRAANTALSEKVASDIEQHWNAPGGTILYQGRRMNIRFIITGRYEANLDALTVISNTNPRHNYFRVEEIAPGNISFVDGLGSNTGWLLLANLLQDSTTAAHEYGHTLGLPHPYSLDLRGGGIPGIMYPRGTLTDPAFQYDPQAAPGAPGGTLNPKYRRVQQADINALGLHRLQPDSQGNAIVGDFSSCWHDEP